jgi:two-component system, chemotaxis family, chemotaxis protein CheY
VRIAAQNRPRKRKKPCLVRNLLHNIGVKKVFDAGDGIAALEMIRHAAPDVVVLDWEMPLLNGAELVRIVRSPGVWRALAHH